MKDLFTSKPENFCENTADNTWQQMKPLNLEDLVNGMTVTFNPELVVIKLEPYYYGQIDFENKK